MKVVNKNDIIKRFYLRGCPAALAFCNKLAGAGIKVK